MSDPAPRAAAADTREQRRPDPGVLGMAGMAVMRHQLVDPGGVARAVEMFGRLSDRRDPGVGAGTAAVTSGGVEDGYTVGASTYDRIDNPMIELEGPVVDQLLEGLNPGVALDAACGTGRHSRRLRAAGWTVLGLDRTDAMLRVAATATDAPLARGDLEALPLADRSVDLVLCALALTHLTSLHPAVGEFARVVRPGGHLVLTDIHPVATATGAQYSARGHDGTIHVVRGHAHWPGAYLDAFRSAGLDVQECMEPEFHVDPDGGEFAELVEMAVGGLPGILAWRVRRPD